MSRRRVSRRARWSGRGLLLLALLLLAAALFWVLRQRSLPPPPPSGGTADWQVAFTSPISPPDDDPFLHQGGLDVKLVELMDRATRTLDVADYDFDLANVAEAMARAARRGARVRLVTDTDTMDNTRNTLVQDALRTVKEARIPIETDKRQPIMHNKFTVVDGEWVQTGSWNYTDGDTYRLNNNMAVFRSPELATNYTVEFEKMFVQRAFGATKPRGVPYPSLNVAGMGVENYFAPQDSVAGRIVDRIQQAQRKIHFLAFSFTHDGIGQAMMDRNQAGVEVQGVFETTGASTPFSEYGRMKQAGLDVYRDGNPYVMHHKVIVLDDRITIFGSFNFSENANRDNDENVLIVDDPAFAALYEQEFQRVLAVAKNPPARATRRKP